MRGCVPFVKGQQTRLCLCNSNLKHLNNNIVYCMKLTWHAKKCPLILTITWSFSSGVWSLGTTTSAHVRFWSSFTCSGRQTSLRVKNLIRTSHFQVCSSVINESVSLFTVFPPFPITRPAAKEGTLMWASSFTSSLGPKKFSSFNLPNMRHCACSTTGQSTNYLRCTFLDWLQEVKAMIRM